MLQTVLISQMDGAEKKAEKNKHGAANRFACVDSTHIKLYDRGEKFQVKAKTAAVTVTLT